MTDSIQHGHQENELIACHECDLLHTFKAIPIGGKAICIRCGAFLYRNVPNSIDRALALYLAAFMLFILTNTFPFITLKIGGHIEENIMASGAFAFIRFGMSELSILVLITGFIFPFLVITGMLYVLFSVKFGYRFWKMAKVLRITQAISPWSLLGVFMLGVLISFVKLRDMATVIPGIALPSLAAFLVVSTAAHASVDVSQIWQRMKFKPMVKGRGNTAAEQNMIVCHTCSLLMPSMELDGHAYIECPRCESHVHSRKTNSITRTWALVVTAIMILIPANVFPVMTISKLGKGAPSTILNGVIKLIHDDMVILAMIILFASIVVPVLKISVLSFLLITVKKRSNWRTRDRAILYRIIESVGAWSMVDIYAVATLIGLVNFGLISNIVPNIGITFFAAVVVITMFATHSFDPRLIWDNAERLK